MRETLANILATLRVAYGLIAERGQLVAALSVLFVILDSLLRAANLPLLNWTTEGDSGNRAFLFLILAVATPAAAPAFFLTAFLRAVHQGIGMKQILAPDPAYLAVFWRLTVLNVVFPFSAGWFSKVGFWASMLLAGVAFGYVTEALLLALARAFVVLRLAPVLAGAAVGRPIGFRAAWTSLSGRFVEFIGVLLGLGIPLQILAAIASYLLIEIATAIDAQLVMVLAPLELALGNLATTLAVAATLAVFWPRLAPDVKTPAPTDDAV